MNHSTRISPMKGNPFEAMGPAAAAYLLMLGMEGPTGARQVAAWLGINEHTASRYLRKLEELRLVERGGLKQGYVLNEAVLPPVARRALGAQNAQEPDEALPCEPSPGEKRHTPRHKRLAFNDDPAQSMQFLARAAQKVQQAKAGFHADTREGHGEKRHAPGERCAALNDPAQSMQHPTLAAQKAQDGCRGAAQNMQRRRRRKKSAAKMARVSTTDSKINLNNPLRDSVVVDEDSKDSQKGEARDHKIGEGKVQPGVWMELYNAGIGHNERTQALVLKPHMTAEYVKAHRMKLEASGKRGAKWAGLLVTILESGEPASVINPNGHLGDCECMECFGYRLARSWEGF